MITEIYIDVDQYSYEGLEFDCDAEASAIKEQEEIVKYFETEYPEAHLVVNIVSNGHGTRLLDVEVDDNTEDSDFGYKDIEQIQFELEYLISNANGEWYVYPVAGENH